MLLFVPGPRLEADQLRPPSPSPSNGSRAAAARPRSAPHKPPRSSFRSSELAMLSSPSAACSSARLPPPDPPADVPRSLPPGSSMARGRRSHGALPDPSAGLHASRSLQQLRTAAWARALQPQPKSVRRPAAAAAAAARASPSAEARGHDCRGVAEDSTEAPLEVHHASPPTESEASDDTGRRAAEGDEEVSAAPAGDPDATSSASTLSRSRCSLHGDVPTDNLSRIASRQEEVRSWLSRSLAAVEVATSPISCSNLLREAHELRARKQALEAVLAAREALPTSNEHKASALRVDELRLKYNTVKKEKLQKEQELHSLHAELEELRAQAETHQTQVDEVQRTRDALAASLQFLEERPVEMDVYLNVGTRGRPTEASLTMAATRDGSERYQAELKLALVDVDRKCAELGHYVETMDHIRRRVVAQTHEVKCEVSRIKDEIAKVAGEKTALFVQLRDLQRQTNLSRGEATQLALVEKEKGRIRKVQLDQFRRTRVRMDLAEKYTNRTRWDIKMGRLKGQLLCQRAQLAISELHSSAGTASSLTKFETIFKLLGLTDVPLEDRIERIVSMVNDPESSIRRYRDEAMLKKEGLITQLKLLTDSLQTWERSQDIATDALSLADNSNMELSLGSPRHVDARTMARREAELLVARSGVILCRKKQLFDDAIALLHELRTSIDTSLYAIDYAISQIESSRVARNAPAASPKRLSRRHASARFPDSCDDAPRQLLPSRSYPFDLKSSLGASSACSSGEEAQRIWTNDSTPASVKASSSKSLTWCDSDHDCVSESAHGSEPAVTQGVDACDWDEYVSEMAMASLQRFEELLHLLLRAIRARPRIPSPTDEQSDGPGSTTPFDFESLSTASPTYKRGTMLAAERYRVNMGDPFDFEDFLSSEVRPRKIREAEEDPPTREALKQQAKQRALQQESQRDSGCQDLHHEPHQAALVSADRQSSIIEKDVSKRLAEQPEKARMLVPERATTQKSVELTFSPTSNPSTGCFRRSWTTDALASQRSSLVRPRSAGHGALHKRNSSPSTPAANRKCKFA